ncbi:MAG: hypothetical protein RIS64_425 [Bacteroidota bacterium]
MGLILSYPKNKKNYALNRLTKRQLIFSSDKNIQTASNQANHFPSLIHLLAQSSVKFANLSRMKHIIFFIKY